MFGKYIPCRDAAITKLDAKDITHDPSAYRLLACLLACLSVCTMSMAYQYSFTNCLLAWLEVAEMRPRFLCNGGELGCKFG